MFKIKLLTTCPVSTQFIWNPISIATQLLQKEEIENFIQLSGFSSTSITEHTQSTYNDEKPGYVVDKSKVMVYDNVTTYSIAVTSLR